MEKTTRFRFIWETDNGERVYVSREFAFADEEFYANMEFVERFYGVKCHMIVTE